MVESVLVLWLVLSIAVGWWNYSRGNAFFSAVLISLLLSPVVGLVTVILTKPKKKELERRRKANSRS